MCIRDRLMCFISFPPDCIWGGGASLPLLPATGAFVAGADTTKGGAAFGKAVPPRSAEKRKTHTRGERVPVWGQRPRQDFAARRRRNKMKYHFQGHTPWKKHRSARKRMSAASARRAVSRLKNACLFEPQGQSNSRYSAGASALLACSSTARTSTRTVRSPKRSSSTSPGFTS